ncbi:hypothetical protein FHS21_002813 [Phyllobacterium trifolii]|uniref:Uncharacterized protein n=1 Tax=Phyllobacterium trifolii TaxID=300193 RepID=A0A839U6M2_9HYPH|nr:hypothetical protein [Phyllobacterium trifolii]MBB3146398.1 hypothetical protein [Phyllobacterium trifolii]
MVSRDELLLIALAAAGENARFTPVQVQKLCFLIDREASHLVGGSHFDFRPYDYGPFDSAVYKCLESLEQRDLVNISQSGRYKTYSLTPDGYHQGRQILDGMPENVSTYFINLANWLRRLSFTQLVATIYRRYPDMKINSVFRG